MESNGLKLWELLWLVLGTITMMLVGFSLLPSVWWCVLMVALVMGPPMVGVIIRGNSDHGF